MVSFRTDIQLAIVTNAEMPTASFCSRGRMVSGNQQKQDLSSVSKLGKDWK